MSERAKREFLLKQQNRDDLEARGSADRVGTQQDLPLDGHFPGLPRSSQRSSAGSTRHTRPEGLSMKIRSTTSGTRFTTGVVRYGV